MAGKYSATYRSDPKNVATARHAVANFARSCGFSTVEVMEIEIATGEALANAVQHGRGKQGGTFIVRAECWDESIVVEVRDSGRGFGRPDPPQMDPVLGMPARGFGITLMRTLMNEVTYSDNGSSVKLVRHRQHSENNGHGTDRR
ncbi:MAG TPA: ATP-binding protein [Candidatus Baltobacteraceae bacterium]|nr:ATP-binding protein [Candidatus Baltobacteraceae bacterium]